VATGYVGILSVELHFPEAGSLKGKRKHVKSAKANLQNRFGASVAEVDHHELWQRTAIAVAAVDREQYHARRVMHEVERFVERWAEVEIIASDLDLHWPEDDR
jgi:uncharacterized protein